MQQIAQVLQLTLQASQTACRALCGILRRCHRAGTGSSTAPQSTLSTSRDSMRCAMQVFRQVDTLQQCTWTYAGNKPSSWSRKPGQSAGKPTTKDNLYSCCVMLTHLLECQQSSTGIAQNLLPAVPVDQQVRLREAAALARQMAGASWLLG